MLEPDKIVGGTGEVQACFDTTCCLLTQTSDTDVKATCECLASEDCSAEAASRRNTQVVAQCPPPGEGAPPTSEACAAAGENCRYTYLKENGLSGCCEGSVCKNNSTGIPVCQAATKEERQLLEECNHAAVANGADELELLTPKLATSVGQIELGAPELTLFGVGPGGCLNELHLHLGNDTRCQLNITVETVRGALSVTDIYGELEDCDGYTGEGLDGLISLDISTEKPSAELSFSGVACDGRLVFESYCVAGMFDLHLAGKLNELTLDDQHIELEGALCTVSPMDECPEP